MEARSVGVKERRERQKETLRREILDAARDLFVRDGYDNVSMRKIAERIEYSPTTIYLYFKDKAELLHEICEDTFAQMIATLEGINQSGGHPVDRLERGMRAYVWFGIGHPNHYRLTFMTPHTHDDLPDGFVLETSLGWKAFSMLRSMVAECIDQGHFHPADPDVVSQAVWTMIHGVTSLLISDGTFPWIDRDTLVDQVVRTTTEGLRVRA
jgi:AcrR family transcriptional regulator